MLYLNEKGIKNVIEQGKLIIDSAFFTSEYQESLIETLSYLDSYEFRDTSSIEITVSKRISLTGKEESIILELGSDYTLVTTGENENDA